MRFVQPVSLGNALKTTLDNYYDLLKSKTGELQAGEYLQLKLVADPIAINDTTFRFWSHYNLLQKADLAIEPTPVSGGVVTSVDQLSRVYGEFIQRLRKYVVRTALPPEDQAAIADLDIKIRQKKELAREYQRKETADWKDYCDTHGTSIGDQATYLQWSAHFGYSKEISEIIDDLKDCYFDKKTHLDKTYADPEDRLVVDAEFAYDSLQMRLRYPIWPDNEYADGAHFTLEKLATLPEGSSALFDDRRALSWIGVSLAEMPSTEMGGFSAEWSHSTSESSSITTDWNASADASYALVSVDVAASEHRQISQDFSNSTTITLSAKAAFKLGIGYPGWFRPELFSHKRLRENLRDFEDFFGPSGKLRYYPTHLLIIRGFAAEFKNSQGWTYDYEKRFSASGGGGFSICGVRFGSKNSYGSHVHEHKVEKAGTTLTLSDGDATLRFVGFVVKENTLWKSVRSFSPIAGDGTTISSVGYTFAK